MPAGQGPPRPIVPVRQNFRPDPASSPASRAAGKGTPTGPGTADPATANPATANPAAADPATADPATADPHRRPARSVVDRAAGLPRRAARPGDRPRAAAGGGAVTVWWLPEGPVRVKAARTRRLLHAAGASRVAIWPDEATVSMWTLLPADLVVILFQLIETGTDAAAYYADVAQAVLTFAVSATPGPPSSAAHLKFRDQGNLRGAAADADGGQGEPGQRDDRSGHRPEGVVGHGAPADGAKALQREYDSRERDKHAQADQQAPHHDCLFSAAAAAGIQVPGRR